MELFVRRLLCVLFGALIVAGLLFVLAAVTGALGGAPAIDVAWRLSGIGAVSVGGLLAAVAVGLLRAHPAGQRILEGLVVALALGIVGGFIGAATGCVPEWAPLLPGIALVGLWGLWLTSHLVDLDRWRR
ncbi:MAG: hypothetical protein KC486_23695 [Myxococcales bacterium]|nr:hypothetical protein [Myxococcales bacterium]